MIKNKIVKEFMSKDLVTIKEEDSIDRAKRLFELNKVRHILVVNNSGKLIGIISNHDILRVSFGDTYGDDQRDMDDAIVNMLTVKDVMRKDPVVITSDTTVEDAIYILLNRRFHSLPVVDNGKLLGIVTTTDFMKLILLD
jgi:CBS domain-containing membrane protein